MTTVAAYVAVDPDVYVALLLLFQKTVGSSLFLVAHPKQLNRIKRYADALRREYPGSFSVVVATTVLEETVDVVYHMTNGSYDFTRLCKTFVLSEFEVMHRYTVVVDASTVDVPKIEIEPSNPRSDVSACILQALRTKPFVLKACLFFITAKSETKEERTTQAIENVLLAI